MTIGQVVHDYGDLFHVITSLAVDHGSALEGSEVRMLNRCLDDAAASAVTEYSRLREHAIAGAGAERLGFLAHELRNVATTSLLWSQRSNAGGGSPRASGVPNVERVVVSEIIEEVEIGAALAARDRLLQLEVTSVDSSVTVEADRQVLVAAVANLVQNALKFTRLYTTVKLVAAVTTDRVKISVEDECGGLPVGKTDHLVRPFTQSSHDRTGLGLGLAVCVKAAKAIGGALVIRDLPGEGCVCTLDLPKPPSPSTALSSLPSL